MSEEVKTDAAPAEAPSAEDLKGQKRTLEAEVADGEIKKQKPKTVTQMVPPTPKMEQATMKKK